MADCNVQGEIGELAGLALTPGSDGTGGWLAHRSTLDKPGSGPGNDWVKEVFEGTGVSEGVDLSSAASFTAPGCKLTHKPRILVLYGSQREKSQSRSLAFECARLLELLGSDVRIFHAKGLPMYDPELKKHPKARELLSLTLWAEGHVWVSPEMHGTITSVFKNQIDWIPLSFGAVRPTQGKTCVILQVNGGSQSFNVVSQLRHIARWMRMPCCTNQSSVPQAWNEFDSDNRMKPSSLRDRVVDVMEEYYQFTLIMREQAPRLNNRYSERKDLHQKGQLTAGKGASETIPTPAQEPDDQPPLSCCLPMDSQMEAVYADEETAGDIDEPQ
jgi:arsenic resistance protein ArsH